MAASGVTVKNSNLCRKNDVKKRRNDFYADGKEREGEEIEFFLSESRVKVKN